MGQTITVTIGRTGEAEIAVKGVSGPKCKDVTKNLEAAMGCVVSDEATAEMHHVVETEHEDLCEER